MSLLLTLASPVGAPSPLLTSLISYWKLDEASGTRIDSQGTNNLTDNNTVTQAVGKVGNAAEFTAANSEYLSIADNVSLSTGDVDFTFAGWVYFTTGPGEGFFVSKDVSGGREYSLEYNSSVSQRFSFNVWCGASPIIATANGFGAASTGTWYFVVAWHDKTADTVNIQINNSTVTSTTTVGVAPNDAAAEFRMGARAFVGFEGYHNGRLDAWGFWKRLLTTAEKTELYNGGNGKQYPF